jgi:hypothetical protein
MEGLSKLLSAVAAIIAALAWPITLLVVVLLFRVELRSALSKIGIVLDRVKLFSIE